MTLLERASAARGRPSLKREMLVNLAMLTGAALSLAVLTALIVEALQPGYALAALVFLIGADVLVVFLFGRYLVERLVLSPMARLTEAADALAAGDVTRRAPDAETREFTDLAARLNHMTDRLLDMQLQLARAEKMAGVGHLAAGIAHEVGNPLAAIGTYVDVLEKRGGDGEVVAALRREAARIDRIIRGLLAYARPPTGEEATVDLGPLLRATVELLRDQGVLRHVRVALEVPRALPPVRARHDLLEQVAVNLLLNAADAAPNGVVVVGASEWRYRSRVVGDRRRSDAGVVRHADRPAVRPWRPELPEGAPGVLFWVADSGPGVPEADRERVFDAFFTTKDPGRGTGLGLAVVQRIVYDLEGVVWVDTAREGGAAFKVFLPMHPAASGENGAEGPNAAHAPQGGFAPPRGR